MKHEAIIKKLTLHEKALLMSGKSVWETWAFEEKGVPSVFLADGPHGIRKQLGSADHLGLNESIKATCFPTAATLANSWDNDLLETVGKSLGKEAKELGVQVVLGPGMNIKRNPLCGRNFEYYSEDPYLTGKLASSYVRGIQSNGIAASPKHFAVNSQELRRMSVDSVIDERTFREIYLRAFEIVVKESQPKFMMTAYNPINGIYANESHHLLQEILYGEWGYDGAVVTDWGGSNDHVKGVYEGSHLEMPSTGYPGALQLVEAVENGELSEEVLNKRVDELLNVVLSIAPEKPSSDYLSGDTVELHHEVAYKAAQESIVLLKNKNNILPLNPSDDIAIIGDFAETPRYQGAGSSLVNATRLDSVLDVKHEYGWDKVKYAKGYQRDGSKNDGLFNEAVELAKSVEKILVFVGLTEISESEGIDRVHMNMEENQLQLLSALSQVNKNVIVVLSGGSAVELPFADDVSGIIHTYLSGQAGSRATLDVLTGKINPSGKLNETYPLAYEDMPNSSYYPGLERTAEYRESIFIGYRYFDTIRKEVRYPFGYGLSYTTFEYSNMNVTKDTVSFKLTNTGVMAGAEVAQVYVNKKSKSIFRSDKELVGFDKIYLEANESKEVTIPLDSRTFEYFNVKTNQWEIEAGNYDLLVGSNVESIHLSGSIQLEGSNSNTVYDLNTLAPYFSGEVSAIQSETFEALLGHKLPESSWNKSKELTENDSISQLYYAKSPIGRLVYKVLTSFINRSTAKGKPNLNLYFNYNMTFRAISKMTGGLVNKAMVDQILRIVNGHFFKGVGGLSKEAIRNSKMNKRGKQYDGGN